MHDGEKSVDTGLGRLGLSGDEQSLTSSSPHAAGVADSPSILRRIRRDIVLLGAGNIGVVLAQLCFRSILVAVLVPAAYGRLSLILSVYNTVWIIGASGLPSSIARYIALIAPGDDSAIIRSAIRAGTWPTIVAASLVAVVASIVLKSPIALLLGAVGLSSLVYSLIAMGILRGRGRIGSAASIMPIAGVGEVVLLALLWGSGFGVTALSGFGVFCLGNVLGLAVGIICVIRTAPHRVSGTGRHSRGDGHETPSSRQLLALSLWLSLATVGIAMLPLVLRLAAVFDSYTIVAIADVALVLFTIPQRMGAVIVAAVVPHASRALNNENVSLMISRREHFIVVVPFVLAAIVVAFTPVVGWLFDFLGRPGYARSAEYLALALLAGPARVLYGLVEGVLIAHDEGRFMAINAFSIAVLASGTILAAAALGSVLAAFIVFAIAIWAIYLCGLQRIARLNLVHAPTLDQD